MPINVSGAVAAPLAVYGSWCTDVSPDALPENVSPDNQEVVYGAGFMGSRPAFEKVAGITFPAVAGVVPTGVYGKSFKTPTGDVKNLYLDSAGRLWVEDFTNAPGAITLLLQSTPGSFCRSLTKFGREYIAISDGLHGTEAPLQYDGTNLDRVTQGGPAAPPSVASVALPPVQMTGAGNTLTRNNNQVTCATVAPHNLKVGYQAQISNVPDSNATTVNQNNPAGFGQSPAVSWSRSGNQWRSNFNPGISSISDLTFNTFNFNIPSNAVILGVVIGFGTVSQDTTAATVNEVALWWDDGENSGTGRQLGVPKYPASPFSPRTITQEFYGSSADTWGLGSLLTPEIVNDAMFGFAISCNSPDVRLFINLPATIQVYYTISSSGTVAFVQSIVINNETLPGLALVTTSTPHGLIPGVDVSIVGVEPAVVSNISTAQWSAGNTTITTAQNHGLTPGAVVQISGVTTATGGTSFSFDATVTVETVPSPNQVTYAQTPITGTDPDVIYSTANTGSISISWPIPDNTPTPTYFEVDSCPTPTTFYVQVTYADGTWTSGTVGFIWEGTYFVTQVLSPTQFSYYQPGPNGNTSAIGTVTPFGQAAPGLHLCQVLWLTRNGAIPAPSPPLTVILNGGQYVSVTNIPIGPPNVIGRILAFTGAQPDVPGELPPFYYIPVPAQLEGQVVSTATVINDNVTTSAFLDFSDNTLYASIGISIPGNNLANQIVLDGALRFSTYLSRLMTWGQRNVIQNLLNLGFEGGYNLNAVNPLDNPLGWTVDPTMAGTGTLVNAHLGMAWQVSIATETLQAGGLSQPAYLDAYGAPIFVGNQSYSVRFWAQGNGGLTTAKPTAYFKLSSVSTGFTSTASVALGTSTAAQWFECDFDSMLPVNIPADLIFSFLVGGTPAADMPLYTVTIDDIQPIFAQTPYLEYNAFTSYTNNPEGMDGSTGQWGAQDTAKLMDMGIVRGTLHLLTQAPTGKLHSTSGSTVTEPSGWDVEPVQGDCGALSAFSLTTSQADDSTEAGGDDWMAWASDVGAMIFGGGKAEKISQEIQPNWNDPTKANTAVQINTNAATSVWGLNDPVARLLMFGLPIGDATAPSQIYVLNYEHLGSAEAIASSPPFHPSFAGKLIATDNSRKWTHWLRPMNGAARMYRSAGKLTNVLFGGNGQTLNTAAGYGNVYTLNPAKFTDDDYGQINPYYVTYFFLDPEKAQMLQLKVGRYLLAFVMAQIQPMPGDANSQVTLTYYSDNMNSPWPLTTTRTLTANFFKDRNFGGGMAQGERIAIKIASSPVAGTDNSFIVTRFAAFFKNARMLLTGVNQ